MVIRFALLLFSLSSFATSTNLEQVFNDQSSDYKAKNWSKVLARGHFYRHNYLRNENEIKAAFSPNLYQLEIFALAEKCQWGLVDQMMGEFKRLEKIKYDNLTYTQTLAKKIDSFRAYKVVTKEKSVDLIPSKDHSILVRSIDWSKINNLDDIEIELEDKCQK